MKLHLYFCSSFLAQKPLGKWCNALRLLPPTCFVNSLGGLSAMPRQGNKEAILAPTLLMHPLYITACSFGVI